MLILVHLETMLVLTQDSCMVWARRTMAAKTILDAPDGTFRFEAQVEVHFCPFENRANLDAR
jgi:hypothetical protein